MSRRCRALALLPIIATLTAGLPPAGADSPPPAYVESDFETPNLDLHRDGGVSVPLAEPFAGQSLWLFGDTFVSDGAGNPAWGVLSFLPGTFGAIGPATPGVVPTVREIPAPGSGVIDPTPPSPPLGPAFFLPLAPADLRLPDDAGACGAAGTDSYPVNWGLGAIRGPNAAMTLYDEGTTPVSVTAAEASKLVFISYFGVCMHHQQPWTEGIRIQRMSMVAYDPATNSFRARWDVFDTNVPTPTGDALPWQHVLWHPQFSGGHMYAYASNCDDFNTYYAACLAGPVIAVRAPISSLHDGSAYRYWTNADPGAIDHPSNWSGDPADAESIIPSGGGGPLQLHVADFGATGDGYLMMEQTSMGAHYRLFQAPSPVGPWAFVRTGQAPNCVPAPDKGCYALTGHPELSTPSQLLYSFADMTDKELEVVALDGVP